MGGVVLFYKKLMGGVTGDVKPPFYRDHVLVCGMLGSVLLFFSDLLPIFVLDFPRDAYFGSIFFQASNSFMKKSEKI